LCTRFKGERVGVNQVIDRDAEEFCEEKEFSNALTPYIVTS